MPLNKNSRKTPTKAIKHLATGTKYVSNPNLSDATPTDVLGNSTKSNTNFIIALAGIGILLYWYSRR